MYYYCILILATGFLISSLTKKIYNQTSERSSMHSLSDLAQIPTTSYSIYFFLMDIFFYYILTLYFDQVVPNQYGQYQNLLFFLKPSYWGLDFTKKDRLLNWQIKTFSNSGGNHKYEEEDDDVIKERLEATRNGIIG